PTLLFGFSGEPWVHERLKIFFGATLIAGWKPVPLSPPPLKSEGGPFGDLGLLKFQGLFNLQDRLDILISELKQFLIVIPDLLQDIRIHLKELEEAALEDKAAELVQIVHYHVEQPVAPLIGD